MASHTGSPVGLWLLIFLLHNAMSVSSSALSQTLVKSLVLSQPNTCQVSRPLSAKYLSSSFSSSLPFPSYVRSQHITRSSRSLFFISLFTWSYQFNRLSLICLEACITHVVHRMCWFLVTPHIRRSILISFTSIRLSCFFFAAHV